jgi:hypothetical protein
VLDDLNRRPVGHRRPGAVRDPVGGVGAERVCAVFVVLSIAQLRQ